MYGNVDSAAANIEKKELGITRGRGTIQCMAIVDNVVMSYKS